MRKGTRELLVGIFVVTGLVILVAMLVRIGSIRLFEEKYEIVVVFEYLPTGLSEGAPVRMAGVPIGTVKQISLAGEGPDRKVQVTLELDKSEEVCVADEVRIATMGLMGEKVIQIMPGSSNQVLLPGERIPGETAVDINQMIRLGKEIANQLREVVTSINLIVGTEESRQEIRETMANAHTISQDLKKFATALNEVLEENRQPFAEAISSFEKSGRRLRTNLIDSGEKFNELLARASGFLDANDEQVQETIRNFQAISQSIRRFAESLEKRPIPTLITGVPSGDNDKTQTPPAKEGFWKEPEE